jgi:hypothetical protein
VSLLDEARRRLAGETDDPSPAGGELVLRPLSEFRARPVRYLVPRTIPVGKVTMVAGVGGMGKSTIMRHLIARLTSGRVAFGLDYQPDSPFDVMLASVEDSPQDTILPHLASEGADLGRVLIVDGVRKDGWKPGDRTAPFDLRDLDLVMAQFDKRPAVRLMVIDPVGSFVARSGANENSSAEVRALLDPLHDLADRTGVAVVLIAHLNKANNVAAVNRIVGTAAFRDTCRAVYVLGHDPDDPTRRVLAVAKENVPGIDTRGLAFRRVSLDQAEAAAVLATRQMVELTDFERAELATQLARVEPGGRVDIDADQALGTGTGKKIAAGVSKSERETCSQWIVRRLGTVNCWYDRQIEEEAVMQGFSTDTYRKAKKHVPGLRCRPIGYQGRWRVGIGDVATMTLSEQNSSSETTETTETGGQNGPVSAESVVSDHELNGEGPGIWPG